MVALDDRALTRTGAWTDVRAPYLYGGGYSRSMTRGASLSMSGTRSDAGWLVVLRCPTCGSVGVYDDGVLVTTADLRGTAAHQALVPLPHPRSRTGTLSVRILSTGKPVLIDGLALRSF